jgi:hypothetical protein
LGFVLLVFIDAPNDFDAHRQSAQAWVDKIDYEEGVTYIWNLRAVLSFGLNLRLIRAEMHHAPADFAYTGIIFNGHISMSSDRARTESHHEDE